MKKTYGILALIALLLLPALPARADLMITPVRVVFQPRDRSAVVTLLNMTDHVNTYRMGWLVPQRGPNGQMELVTPDPAAPSPHGVDKMIIFTPRQVMIEPGASQTIRLSLRRPADLPDGEYRAHLSMMRLAPDTPSERNPNQKGPLLDLRANLGFSIPVIVRSGEDKDLKMSIQSPKITMNDNKEAPTPLLDLHIHRDAGKFSSYGVVKVFLQQPGQKEREIGTMTNVAIYPEVETRNFRIPLTENPTSGTLRVVYSGKYESEGTVWDDKVFPITR